MVSTSGCEKLVLIKETRPGWLKIFNPWDLLGGGGSGGEEAEGEGPQGAPGHGGEEISHHIGSNGVTDNGGCGER